MTGLPDFNYDAFHEAAAWLRAIDPGRVINPAENHDGIQTLPREMYLRTALGQVLDSDGVVLLAGWEESEGARLEVAVAVAAGIPVYTYSELRDVGPAVRRLRLPGPTPQAAVPNQLSALLHPKAIIPALAVTTEVDEVAEIVDTDILTEAKGLVFGDRQDDYGHPFDDMSRTAKIWSAILGRTVTPSQVALCMVGVKMSREVNRPKRDNRVDGAGYFGVLQMVRERQAENARAADAEFAEFWDD